jgi:Mrp family chromosome partitioning ATPase
MAQKSKCDACDQKSENCRESCPEGSNDQPQAVVREEIKSVIAVMSGKGGVGKSTVTALLAAAMAKKGFQTGILDGDITGPSIPKLLGLKGGKVATGRQGLIAPQTASGIKVMSLNLLLEQEDEAVIWRGPMLASAVKQFWEDVDWGELDYLFVDLPPGTGDVPLTVLQSLPLSGVVIVLSPQDLAVMVVKKAVRMAQMMDVPILGLIENMAYLQCPHCNKKIYPFGLPQGERLSSETGIPLLATLPLQPAISSLGDSGALESYDTGDLEQAAAVLAHLNTLGVM